MAHDQKCSVLCCQRPEGPECALQGGHSTLSEPCQVSRQGSVLQVGWTLCVLLKSVTCVHHTPAMASAQPTELRAHTLATQWWLLVASSSQLPPSPAQEQTQKTSWWAPCTLLSCTAPAVRAFLGCPMTREAPSGSSAVLAMLVPKAALAGDSHRVAPMC